MLEPQMSWDEAVAILTAPGADFETVEEMVLGESMLVFKNRARTLPDLLRSTAERFGNADCHVFDGGPRATFTDVADRAASVALALSRDHGIGPGDRVAILAANCMEWIDAFWAVVSLGGIVVAMNGWWTAEEVDYGMALTSPKLLVVDRPRLERMSEPPDVPTIVIEDDFADLLGTDASAGLPEVEIAEDDPAAILFTSGTTARPKGAVTSHRCFGAFVSMSHVGAAINALRFPPTDPAPAPAGLATSPLFHVSGLHTSAITGMASGVKSVWPAGRFDADNIMRLTAEEKISHWGGVTTHLWRLVQSPNMANYDLSSVRSVGGGGSVWSPELQRTIRQALPNASHSVMVGYGLTESGGLACTAHDELLRRHPDSVGRPIPTVEVAIKDPSDVDLPEGEEGEVCLRGPGIIPGYWNNPEATRLALRPGRWLRTGDIGRLVDGVLYLSARKGDMIIRGGENISPVEIENRLDEHPFVVEAAVIGVEHRELGQEVKAIVVHAPGAPVTSEELSAFVGQALSYYKVPSIWEIRTEPLPRNITGKVLKRELLEG
ncbi:MAG: class I adenylate-forming enzyme family protein [Acidimicrobiales bacterium]